MVSFPILVTGATGYVGGRLVPFLAKNGHGVRAMGRSLDKLACRPWASHANVKPIQGDVLDIASLRQALKGCTTAYYLIHSMEQGNDDFAAMDRKGAVNFAEAAAAEGVERIIYLSGLLPKNSEDDPTLSKHLRSRAEVATLLGQTQIPVTTLKAAQILGAGSASFEILRYLVDRLPIMLTPRWVRTLTQPISISDVLGYLKGCLDNEQTIGESFDIGGPDVVSYGHLFHIYSKAAGLRKRSIVPVPFLTPWLSSHWISLITPLPAALAKPLILGLKNSVVCHDHRIRELIPLNLMDCRTAMDRALNKVAQHSVDTCWSDAGTMHAPEWMTCGDPEYSQGKIQELSHVIRIKASREDVWRTVKSIGGENGWYWGNFLWKLRGWMDTLSGGVGLRRGRRDPEELFVGDALDFWRVLSIKEQEELQLVAEMKVPGEAMLRFTLSEPEPGVTDLVQTSRFLPRGLYGISYWYMTYPPHILVFRGMLKSIATRLNAPILHGPAKLNPKKQDSCALASKTPSE
ncbi:MAG: SDR family oxidoreductase [Desulfovibrio sp.]|nr:MAG: SDR family oxidoreductase [Desulfovibrio sp.]